MTGPGPGGAAGGVHQFVPMLHVGDAVGRHTMAVQAHLRGRGVASEIYVELDDPDTAHLTRPAVRYPDEAGAGDVLVYQLATASDLAGWLVRRPEPLVVNYHNVTPPELFAAWDNGLARHQVRARQQVGALAARAVLGVAVSEFNRADLVAAGFAATAVVPPVVDLEMAAGDARPPPPARGARWLCVGRLAPNKAVEDVLAALFWYRASCDDGATLRVVGRPSVGAYVDALHAFCAELGLIGAVEFAGGVDDAALGRAYDEADVLVVASEHEGFCLPVVEAFAHRLPVVAYRQGALAEVMGDGGVLLDAKDPRTVAAAVHRLLTDAAARQASVAAGLARLGALHLESAAERLGALLLAVRADPAGDHGERAEEASTAGGAR